MWKKVLAGSAALAIVGTTLALAQQAPGWQQRGGPQHWRPSAEDISAFTDARVAAMKAGLKLTPDQDKNWPAFESAYRGVAKIRADRTAAAMARRAQRQQQGGTPQADGGSIVDRMQKRAAAQAARAAAMSQFAGAAAPLYTSLDDGQKRRFAMFLHAMRPHHQHFAQMRDRGQGGQGGEGWRRGGGERGPGFRGPNGRRFGEQPTEQQYSPGYHPTSDQPTGEDL